jgi:hypothetical protein
VQADRRHLHRASLGTARRQGRQELPQHRGAGRGVRSGLQFTRKTVAERADHRAAHPRLGENQAQRRQHRIGFRHLVEMAAEQTLLDQHALVGGAGGSNHRQFLPLAQVVSHHHQIAAFDRAQSAGDGLGGHSHRPHPTRPLEVQQGRQHRFPLQNAQIIAIGMNQHRI